MIARIACFFKGHDWERRIFVDTQEPEGQFLPYAVCLRCNKDYLRHMFSRKEWEAMKQRKDTW